MKIELKLEPTEPSSDTASYKSNDTDEYCDDGFIVADFTANQNGASREVDQYDVDDDKDSSKYYCDDSFIVVDFAAYLNGNDNDEDSLEADSDSGPARPKLSIPAVTCVQCKKPFHSALALKQHVSRVHCVKARPFVCDAPDCGKAFRSRFGLRRHSMIHSGERPYRCETCGRGFLEKGHLQVHQRIHSGERPYRCNHCQRCFAHKPHAIEHERIHSGERPFPCKQCGKTFKRQAHLRGHEKAMHKSGALAAVNLA